MDNLSVHHGGMGRIACRPPIIVRLARTTLLNDAWGPSKQMDTHCIGMLTSREIGYRTQLNMRRFFMDTIIQQMRTSTLKFTASHKFAINSIDVDPTGRYLLSAGKTGDICVHDLERRTGEDGNLIPLVESLSGTSGRTPSNIETIQWFPQNADYPEMEITRDKLIGYERKVAQFRNLGCTSTGVQTEIEVKETYTQTEESIGNNQLLFHELQSAFDVISPDYKEFTESVQSISPAPQSPEGLFASSGRDGCVRIWDANTMNTIEEIRIKKKVYQHRMSPIQNTPIIAVASESSNVRLLDVRTGQMSHELVGHSDSVRCCAWSPTEEHLLATGSLDCRILLWDTRSGKKCVGSFDNKNRDYSIKRRVAHQKMVTALGFTPHGHILMSSGDDLKLHGWIVNTQKLSQVNYKINTAAVGAQRASLTVDGYSNYNVCFVTGESFVFSLHVETGKILKRFDSHYLSVDSLYFHKERMELYTASRDREILLYKKPFDNQSTKYKINSYGQDWSDSSEYESEGNDT